MRRFALILLVAALTDPSAAQSLLRGEVRDAQSGESLPAVTVQVEGTTRGTITNASGRFSIYIEAFPATLVVRHIGYRIGRWTMDGSQRDLHLGLDPAAIELEEIVISGEDPAVRIMRRVLSEKRRQRAGYRSWYAEVYSRFLLYRNGSAVRMTETIDGAYWTPIGGSREIVRAIRSRPSRSEAFRFAGQIPVPNLMDDDVVLFGRRFIGPLHPDALEKYQFTLAGTRRLDEQTVFDIAVSPRDPLEAGFIGALSVLDSVFVVLEARLRPLPGTPWTPPVIARNLRLEQRFGPFRGGVWLPVDLRMEGDVTFGRLGSAYPRARYTQVSSLTLHGVDAPVPDSLLVPSDRLVMAPFAERRDDLFRWNPGLVPPTEQEAADIARINPTLSLAHAFRPGGLLAAYTAVDVTEPTEQEERGSVLRFPWVRYDRVDGIFLGAQHTQPLGAGRSVTARLGKPLDRSGLSHQVSGSLARGPVDLQLDWEVGTLPVGGDATYGRLLPGLLTYLGTDEYYDFYHTRRGSAVIGFSLGPVRLSGGVRRAVDRSIVSHADDEGAVVYNEQRTNPAIEEGSFDAGLVGFTMESGPLDLRLNGSFVRGHDAIATAEATLRYPTVFSRREHPGLLRVFLRAGTAGSNVPSHYLGSVDVASGPISAPATLGGVRGSPWIARRYAAIFVEQDFSTAIWERLGWLALASHGFHVAVFAAMARTENAMFARGRRQGKPFDTSYGESGLALSLPFGLPIRVQVAVQWDVLVPVVSFRLGSAVH